MRTLLLSFLLLIASSGLKAQTEQSDSVLRTLKEELNYSMAQLKQKPVPAYFMSLRMQDSQTLSINSDFGSASVNDNHSRVIVPNIRIGSKELDNYKFENQGIEQANNRGAQGDGVAISGGPLRQYRDEIWYASMNRYRTAVMPGVMSVREAVMAMEAGADILKVFPGDLFGPKIIKDIRGPIPYAKMMPTGGVNADNVGEWIKAGAVAVGAGSSLTAGAKTGDYALITATARKFRENIISAREALK